VGRAAIGKEKAGSLQLRSGQALTGPLARFGMTLRGNSNARTQRLKERMPTLPA
jgi:hypothetical protein